MMENEYRIVRGPIMPFALQIKRWWWPIWGTIDWFHDIESAKKYAKGHARGLVEYLGSQTGEERNAT